MPKFALLNRTVSDYRKFTGVLLKILLKNFHNFKHNLEKEKKLGHEAKVDNAKSRFSNFFGVNHVFSNNKTGGSVLLHDNIHRITIG